MMLTEIEESPPHHDIVLLIAKWEIKISQFVLSPNWSFSGCSCCNFLPNFSNEPETFLTRTDNIHLLGNTKNLSFKQTSNIPTLKNLREVYWNWNYLFFEDIYHRNVSRVSVKQIESVWGSDYFTGIFFSNLHSNFW